MDDQSETSNLTIIDLLKAYGTKVDQRDQWERYLPMVEYAYNNTIHTSTGGTPFEIIEGKSKFPLMVKYLSNVFMADEFSKDLMKSFQNIKDAIFKALQKQKLATNKHWQGVVFKENDLVLLRFPKACLTVTTSKGRQGCPMGHQSIMLS